MTQPNDPNTPPPTPTPSYAAPGDQEIVYFEGRPMLRADQAKAMLWALLGIVLIALPVFAWIMDWGWPWWIAVICILVAIAVIVIPWMIIRTTRYRISNYRIDYERGILTKKIDTLELWHVDDIKFEQGLIDRMMNVGCIIVISNDKTTPRLDLHGVPNPRSIFDALKERIIAVKRQRGVIKMDMGA
jgi:membrane protein YdbS with pleckstrin-like domain